MRMLLDMRAFCNFGKPFLICLDEITREKRPGQAIGLSSSKITI